MRSAKRTLPSYAECYPEAIQKSTHYINYDGVSANHSILPVSSRETCSYGEHHICMNVGRAPSLVEHVVEGIPAFQGKIRPGEFVFVPARCPVRWTLCTEGQALSIRLGDLFLKTMAMQSDMNPDRVELIPRIPARTTRIVAIGKHFLDELRSPKNDTELMVSSLGNQLALLLLRNFLATPARATTQPDRLRKTDIQKAIDLIHSRLDDPPSVPEMAKAANSSLAHFERLFKITTGSSPVEYVNRHRTERAKELFQQGGRTIEEIAIILGFKAAAHFSRVFKQYVGIPPSLFQENLRVSRIVQPPSRGDSRNRHS